MTPNLLSFRKNLFGILAKNSAISPRVYSNYLFFILFLLIGYLITFHLKSNFKNYLYAQTSISSIDILLSQIPSLYSFAQLLLFYLLCITVFIILRMGTSRNMAVALTFFFVTSTQVLIVFFSAPYYNLLSRIYVLLGLIVVLVLVKTRVKISLESATVKLAKLILFLLLIISTFIILKYFINISFIKYLFLGQPVIKLISALALFCLFLLFYVADIRKFLFRPTAEELIYLILTSTLLLLFLLDAISGQTRLFNILFFIPFFCVPLITTFQIRARYKLIVFLIFILVVYYVFGRTGLNNPILYYLSMNYQNSTLMLLGTTQSPIQLAIIWSDFAFYDFVDHLQLELGSIKGYLSLVFSFFPHYLNTLLVNIKLIFQGAFIYDSIFTMPIFIQPIIDFFFKIFGTFSFLAGILSPLILIRRNKKQGLVVLGVFLILVFLPLISRISLHQYWFFPIFGLWSFGYLITIIYKEFLPKLLNLSFVLPSILTSKLPHHTLLSASILTLMFFCSYFIDSGIKLLRDSSFSTNIQTRQVELYSQSYSALPRKKLNTSIFIGKDTGPNMKRILVKVPSETNLIEITTKQVCSLSNLTVVLNSPNREVPTRLRTNKISATQVYIPLIYKYPNSITTLEILSFSNCHLDFYSIDTNNLKEPLFALIAPHFDLEKVAHNTVFPNYTVENSSNLSFEKIRSAEFFISKKHSVAASWSFFGWVNPQRYKSVTDGHRLFGRPMSELSAQVLGITDQGRFSSDLWRVGPITPKQDGSIWISGNVQRGTSIIGVTYGEKVLNSRQVPFALYELVGSDFSNESINYLHCFPVYKNIKYTTFVGSVNDLYSPTLIKQSILGVKESNEPCRANSGNNDVWQHTL
jgi:hypothetical protein